MKFPSVPPRVEQEVPIWRRFITTFANSSAQRNQVLITNVTGDVTAKSGDYLSITCSTADITVTLPSAIDNDGYSIFIHKTDGTGYKVIVTGVADIYFEGSTMHLVSNGTDWVIS